MNQDDLNQMDIPSSEGIDNVYQDQDSLNAYKDANEAYANRGYSNAQPIWHLVLLLFITFGLYQYYWFYRNWKQLSDQLNLGWRPMLRTALLFIPLANLIVVFWLFQDILDFSRSVRVSKTFSLYLVFITYFRFFGIHLVLSEPYARFINLIWGLIMLLLPIWSLAVVQRTLNAYWEKKQPGLPVRTDFSLPEICLMLIVIILMAYTFLWPDNPYIRFEIENNYVSKGFWL